MKMLENDSFLYQKTNISFVLYSKNNNINTNNNYNINNEKKIKIIINNNK